MAVVKLAEFNLAWLHTFVCVYRLGGYTKAADHLGIDQSSVSRQLKALGIWFGRDLLTKSRPPRLTEGGKRAYALAEKTVLELCDFNNVVGRSVRGESLSEQDQACAEGLRIFSLSSPHPGHAE